MRPPAPVRAPAPGSRLRLLSVLAAGGAGLALAALLLAPRPAPPGTLLVLVSSPSGGSIAATPLEVGGRRLTLAGAVPRAPGIRTVARLTLPAAGYALRVGGRPPVPPVAVRSGQVEPVLIAVDGGGVAAGGVYAGAEQVSLGLQELGGRLRRLDDFRLLDQDGRLLDRAALAGRDTVVAAFHTDCRETCPLYTGLLLQLRRSAPEVRLVEISTDPARDDPAALAAYRGRVGADWTLATGDPSELGRFWAQFGVPLAVGDTHTSVLALIDRHGYIRAAYSGVPDLGGRLPDALSSGLSPAGRALLSGHGEGWGAPQVLDSLRAISGRSEPLPGGSPAPDFSLPGLDGHPITLAGLRGRPLVLNFWYSSCPPCRQEMPLLQRTADANPAVALVLVDHLEEAGPASSFAASLRVTAPIGLDRDGAVTAAYRVAGFPTTVFIRADGTEEGRFPGALSAQVLSAHIAAIAGG